MGRYIVRRLLLLIPTLFGVSVIIFALVRLMPGDPAQIFVGVEQASEEQMAVVRHEMGLDRSLPVQYGFYVARLARGDLGNSFANRFPVATLVADRFPATVELALAALLIALIIAVPVGVVSAVRQYSWLDNLAMGGALVGVSMPTFWLGLLLILLFALQLQWLPASGIGTPVWESFGPLFRGQPQPLLASLQHLLLPALTLSTALLGLLVRLVRSSMLDVLHADYVRTARAKGLNERLVIYRHAFRNALIPVVTLVGLQIGGLLSGSVITETVFAWPGIGRLVIDAILQRDYPIVQGVTLVFALVFVLSNLLVDLSYGLLDPKIRYD